jgi:hypothetical protein
MPGVFPRKNDEARAGIDHHSQTCSVDDWLDEEMPLRVCSGDTSVRWKPDFCDEKLNTITLVRRHR